MSYCDHSGCLNRPCMVCTCRRCDSEPENEKFWSCADHEDSVAERHLRIRDRAAEFRRLPMNKDKNAYRTPADEPEPEWKELTTFEVEVSSLGQSDGVKMYGRVKSITNFEHSVGTHDERAKATLRLGQRVRVILQVLAALALAGCSSSSKNDELFGTGGTYGEASVGGSGGAAGAAGAGTGGVAGAGAAGAPAGGGGAGVDAGPACTVIQVVGSVYANNCGTPTPLNGVAGACDGETDCTYDFAFAVDPGFDPKPGCPKDLTVTYLCVDGLGETRGSKSAYTPPDAATTKLECGCY